MENLGLRLLYANSESEVEKIIKGDSDMRNPANWHPVDGRTTNHNVIVNQSVTGGKAATELITNMVDAILTKECLKRGIDPRTDKAPKTMYEAVEEFIPKLKAGGKITKADEKRLMEYGRENLVIGITGYRSSGVRPCYVFCDNGEGQSPDNFADTFLSLSAKYKSEIPFVQGKYSMGSSGVLNFCGQNWHKLIVSRRYDGKTPWGWTLVRRNPAGLGYAEYFAPQNKIPTMGNEKVFPLKEEKEFDKFSLKTGTVIKLYEYFIGTNINFRESREVFHENLVETVLPFRIYDCRWKPDKKRGGLRAYGIDERPFYGMEFHLLRNLKEEIDASEVGYSDLKSEHDKAILIDRIKDSGTVPFGHITISAVVLKKNAEEVDWYKNSPSRIFHHVNGQVQYKQSRGALTRWKLGALKNRIAIFVDSSKLSDEAHRIIWKGDRETIIKNPWGTAYEQAVENSIKNSDILKRINHRIEKEMLEVVAKDSSGSVVKNLVQMDKGFSALLEGGIPGINLGGGGPKDKKPRGDLKYSPTYVELVGRTRHVKLPINKGRPINCDTDAADDFLSRPDNRGDLVFKSDDGEIDSKFSYRAILQNGELTVFMTPIKSVCSVGDRFKFQVGLLDSAMPMGEYTEELEIEISEPSFESKPAKKKDKPEKTPKAGLPPHILATKEGDAFFGDDTVPWSKVPCDNFDDKDGGFCVIGANKKATCYVNCENAFFVSHLNSVKSSEADKTRFAQKYILGMRIMMLGIEHTLTLSEKFLEKKHGDNAPDIQDEIRRRAAGAAASVVLTLTETLPEIYRLEKDTE